MRGETLYPLNELRLRYPDAYESERRKYVGREALLGMQIPLLALRWNDALHLAPIHPSRLAAAWRSAGLWSDVWDGEFFEIPLDRIAGYRCAWFAAGALAVEAAQAADDVAWFRADAYHGLTEPPAAYHEHLRQRRLEGRRPRPFAHIPHVLVPGSIDVASVTVVRANEPATAEGEG